MLQLNQSAPTDWSATPQDEESKAKLHWPQRGIPRTTGGKVITMHGTCAWYFKLYGFCILLMSLTLSHLSFFQVQPDAGTKIYHNVRLPSAPSRLGFEDVVA